MGDRASCTVPRLQVRPLVSNNEDLNSPKQGDLFYSTFFGFATSQIVGFATSSGRVSFAQRAPSVDRCPLQTRVSD